MLPFSYTKGIATLKFSVTRIKFHSFTRETQTFKEICHLLGLCPWKDHTNCMPCMRHCPCPLTWFELFLIMKILAHVHKPRSVKFIVFNGESFSCEKDTKQSSLHSWWILINNADQLVNIWLYKWSTNKIQIHSQFTISLCTSKLLSQRYLSLARDQMQMLLPEST